MHPATTRLIDILINEGLDDMEEGTFAQLQASRVKRHDALIMDFLEEHPELAGELVKAIQSHISFIQSQVKQRHN